MTDATWHLPIQKGSYYARSLAYRHATVVSYRSHPRRAARVTERKIRAKIAQNRFIAIATAACSAGKNTPACLSTQNDATQRENIVGEVHRPCENLTAESSTRDAIRSPLAHSTSPPYSTAFLRASLSLRINRQRWSGTGIRLHLPNKWPAYTCSYRTLMFYPFEFLGRISREYMLFNDSFVNEM